jgi:hypothetical protein
MGAVPVENPVGTAPAFIIESERHAVIALPGVPREMEFLVRHSVMPYLRQRFDLKGTIKARILHTAGVGESQIDDLIADLEALSNPSVGLAAHSGQVDIRITAKADSESAADELIFPVEAAIRQRLGNWIYGVDEDTLDDAALKAVAEKGKTLVVVEAGLGGNLIRHLAGASGPFLGGELLKDTPDPQGLLDRTVSFRETKKADIALGVAIQPSGEKQDVHLVLVTPDGIQQFTRPYGGPPEYAPRWALHHSLDLIRNL